MLIYIQYWPSFGMSKLTLPDAAWSKAVKKLDRRNRGNLECKYMLYLVQISMQIHNLQSDFRRGRQTIADSASRIGPYGHPGLLSWGALVTT
jgi:hypothetical protein